jgi:Fe-S cluster biogenesis protein NfuA
MEELYDRVNTSLNEIRGFVKQDGGDLELVEITDEGVAKVELKGACTTCHMNNMTFKAGVEEAILKSVPEIKGVEAINFDLHY